MVIITISIPILNRNPDPHNPDFYLIINAIQRM
jgi:hypothetical protein